MYIIVVGAGTVGYGLAVELLSYPDHEVIMVESDSARAGELHDEFGELVVHGDGTEIVDLEAAGAGRADLMIALTGDDGRNLVACQVAKHWFHVDRAIARINDPRNERLFKVLGIDVTVSAAAAVLAQLETRLPEHTVVPLMQLDGSGLEVVDLHVQEGSVVHGCAIRELDLPRQTVLALVVGLDGAPRVPTADTVLEAGDEVIAVIAENAEGSLRGLFAQRPVSETDPVADDG